MDRRHVPLAVLLCVLVIAQRAWSAETSDSHFARQATGALLPFVVIGEAALLAQGKGEAWRGAEALLAANAVTEVLKVTVREERPNSEGSSGFSFPSGHAATAFAMATAIHEYQPRYTVPAYAVAATIAWSRVELRAHFWHDVIAGAAIGYYAAEHFTENSRVIVSPTGLAYQWQW